MVLLLSSSSCDLLKSLSQLLLLHVGYSYPNVMGHCFSQSLSLFHMMTAWLLLLDVVVEHCISRILKDAALVLSLRSSGISLVHLLDCWGTTPPK